MSPKGDQPKVVDLFSGAGGLSLGAARAGFAVVGALEFDPHAMAAHRINFPNTIHIEMNAENLSGKELRARTGLMNGDLDGIIGGPPCQGFSYIGKNDRNDPRNKLFMHFFRIVSETLPKFFVAENVPGILKASNHRLLDKALDRVAKSFSVLPPMRLSADAFGAPTNRTRVFFIGFRRDEMNRIVAENFKPPTDVETVKVRDALRGLPRRINPLWQTEEEGWRRANVSGSGYYAERLHGHIPRGVGDPRSLQRLRNESRASGSLGTIHTKNVMRRFARVPQGGCDPISKCRRLDPGGYCPTLRAGTGPDRGSYQAVRPLHPTENRVITPREAARLQGFPDWFQFAPSKWHSFRQIGNSVSPILAERVLAVIREVIGDGQSDKE